jgi:hypothetical protein
VNYPTDPVVLATCSPDEVALLASTSEATVGALRRVLATQDVPELLQLAMAAYASLSAPCVSALTRYQQAAPYGGSAQPSFGVSNVYDHGGGTYSMPGVGACGPSGCIPY